MQVYERPSPNFNDRQGCDEPSLIILHYTDTKDLETALGFLTDPVREVSSHYVVDRDGTLYRLVDEEKRAWHAGRSFWQGITDLNSHSIGIELVNGGHAYGPEPYPQVQISAVSALCNDLTGRYKIMPQNILAHSDIAPARKQDPGALFPWASLAEAGIGLWPLPEETDYREVKSWDLDAYVYACRTYGYDPECGYEDVLRAYERHFAPELILGTQTDETIARARLACLLRLKQGTTHS